MRTPKPGGSWAAYGTSHQVGAISHQGHRWLPACDVTGDSHIDDLHHVLAHLGEDLRPPHDGDRPCHCEAGAPGRTEPAGEP